jgi:hypothetical protein
MSIAWEFQDGVLVVTETGLITNADIAGDRLAMSAFPSCSDLGCQAPDGHSRRVGNAEGGRTTPIQGLHRQGRWIGVATPVGQRSDRVSDAVCFASAKVDLQEGTKRQNEQ